MTTKPIPPYHRAIPPLNIGDKIWVFDQGNRVYHKDASGRSVGPVWREYWQVRYVIGETCVSWLVSYSRDSCPDRAARLPKRGFVHAEAWAFSAEEIDERAWIDANRHRLKEHVGGIGTYALLKQVAALVGYVERSAP